MTAQSFERRVIEDIQPAMSALERHSIFGRVRNIQQLRTFMEHHVFAVWDFMSLLKFLQGAVAPVRIPWMPLPNGVLVRLVNGIVLAEKCDEPLRRGGGYASHFDLYVDAMEEVGANVDSINGFLDLVSERGLDAGLASDLVPEPSRTFMRNTFDLLDTKQQHRIAASFAFGRENVIPGMFNSLLAHLGIDSEHAPTFHYYLERHAKLDGEEHGPAALRLVTTLCENKVDKIEEAVESAKQALASRGRFWDAIEGLL